MTSSPNSNYEWSLFSVSVVGPLSTHPVPGRPGPAQAAQASGPFKNPPSSQGYHAQVTWSAESQSQLSLEQWWWSCGEPSFTDTMFWVSFNPGLTEEALHWAAWHISWHNTAVSWHRDTADCRSWRNTAAVWPAERLYTHWLVVFTKLQRKAALAVRVLTVK